MAEIEEETNEEEVVATEEEVVTEEVAGFQEKSDDDLADMSDEEYGVYMTEVQDHVDALAREEAEAEAAEANKEPEPDPDPAKTPSEDPEPDPKTAEEVTDPKDTKDVEQPEQNSQPTEKKDDTEKSEPETNEPADLEDADKTPKTTEPIADSKVEKIKIKADGQDIELSLDELKVLAQKGVNYTQKMQDLSKSRHTLTKLQNADVDADTLNLLLDAKSGNKAALGILLKNNNLTALDLEELVDDQKPYVTDQKEISVSEQQLAEVLAEITTDPEFARTQAILDTEWDEESRNAVLANPQLLNGLHQDVKSGLYEEVSAETKKAGLLSSGRLNDLDLYLKTGPAILEKRQKAAEANKPATEPTKEPTKEPVEPVAPLKDTNLSDLTARLAKLGVKKVVVPPSSTSRIQAGLTKTVPGSTNKAPKGDLSNLTDEEFEAFYASIK